VIPAGATHLIDLRMGGKRPPGAIWVTDDRKFAARVRTFLGSWPLVVDFEKPYDMRCVHGLDVILITASERGKTVAVSQAILEAEPRSFLVDVQGEREWVVPIPCKS
jgi:hypothetical protein